MRNNENACMSMTDHLRIAAWLRRHIETGELPAGERVPSRAELMKLFDVGAHAARRALNELTRESLIISERGRGAFAREVRPAVRLVFGQHTSSRPFHPTAHRESRTWHSPTWEAQATLDVAQALDIPSGSQITVHRSYYATPRREIQLAITYRPVHLTDPVEPVRFRDELTVRLPDAAERHRMELTIAAPVIDIARTSYAANDQPVELIHAVMDANAYLLEYHYPTTEGPASQPAINTAGTTP